MFKLIAVVLSVFVTGATAQSWQNLPYGDKPIPIKFFKAESSGKSPAVLLVHGTGGPSNREENWAKFLSSNGVSVLVVDFKTGRFSGDRDRHIPFYPSLIERTHNWLKEQANVDQGQITYMGLSLGGFLGFRQDSTTDFARYIMFYPGCHNLNRVGNSYMVEKERINPTLLVWGTDDSYEEGTFCPQVVKKMSGNFEWLAIQGAGHGFDGDRVVVSFGDIASPSGRASLSPNTSATNIARSKVLQFIKPVK